MTNTETTTVEKTEKMVSWAYVELLNEAHKIAMRRIFIIFLVFMILAFAVISYYAITWNQYDTISYEQDGQGINIIGNQNEAGQYGTEIEDPQETESE